MTARRSASRFLATARVAAVMAAGVAVAATSDKAYAVSAGCASINQGAWNSTNFSGSQILSVGAMVSGDVINLTSSGSLSSFSPRFDIVTNQGVLQQVPMTAQPTLTVITLAQAYSNVDLGFPNATNATTSATCTPAGSGPGPTPPPTPDNASYDRAVTKGFLLSRINGMLLNSPGAMSLVNRNNTTLAGPRVASAGNGAASAAGGAAAFASAMGLGSGLGASRGDAVGRGASRFDDTAEEATLGSRNLQFSQSLSGLRRQVADERMKRERMSLGAGDGATLPLAYEITSPWDIWVEGRYSGFSDDAGNIDRDGHVGLLYVGGDYRVAQNMIVGVLAQFDWAKDDSGVLGSSVDGNGWMIGPYMSMQVHENVYFDLRASWGRSNNDLDIGATTGSFDTSRWLVKGTLAGNWVYDAWRITPTAELAYVTESQDSFTNSGGVFVAGQDVSLGRLQFGPEIGYRFAHTADTFIEPFAAIKGVWDWDNPNVAIIDGFIVGPGDFWGRLEGGLNVTTSSGWLVRGLASWDGLGTNDYNGYTLQGIVNVPLN